MTTFSYKIKDGLYFRLEFKRKVSKETVAQSETLNKSALDRSSQMECDK